MHDVQQGGGGQTSGGFGREEMLALGFFCEHLQGATQQLQAARVQSFPKILHS